VPDFGSGDEQFHGRRKGKPLRAGRRLLWDTLLPRLTLPIEGMAEGEMLDPATLFEEKKKSYWLEIGFGGGEHLTAQAQANPDVGFIGSEVFEYGVGKALSQIEDAGLTNVRLWPEDVRAVLPRLPDGCLDRLFVLFPDPWPKTRHAKRRMIQPGRLTEFARLLKDGGELRVASDDPTYQHWALIHGTGHPQFKWMVKGPADWKQRPADWVETRYEAKALAAGRIPIYMIFRRLPRAEVV
jgi:tRNA (guanine-N7-)-methyltransferase